MSKVSRFVRPEYVTLTLANGDTLLVLKRLNAGEQNLAYQRMYIAGADGRMRVNPLTSAMGLVTAYLIDWSLTDDEDRPVAIAGKSIEDLTAVLNSLSPEDFGEIKEAIEAHVARVDVEYAEKKRTRSGGTNSDSTSDSPSAAAGPSPTSEPSTRLNTPSS